MPSNPEAIDPAQATEMTADESGHAVLRPQGEGEEPNTVFPGATTAEAAQIKGPGIGFWVLTAAISAVVATIFQVASGQNTDGFFLPVFTFVLLLRAAWFDAATRLIPNSLTYPMILIGIAAHLLVVPLFDFGLDPVAVWLGFDAGGRPGTVFQSHLMQGVAGVMLCSFIGIVSFIARGIGGGDVKILVAMGALLGFSDTWPILINYLPIALVLGLLNLSLNGGIMARAQVLALNLMIMRGGQSSLRDIYPFAPKEMPFVVSIVLAMIITPFFRLHEHLGGFLMGATP